MKSAIRPLTSLRYVKRCDMRKARTIAFIVAAATSLVDRTDSALAQAHPCRSKEYAHNAYTVCEVDLAKHTVRLYWKRSDGTLAIPTDCLTVGTTHLRPADPLPPPRTTKGEP